VGLLVVLGMIFAGISTLEGLIQSLSATITTDIIGKILPKTQSDRAGMVTNRIVIVLIAVIAWLLSWDQLLHANLSVGLFAQNGVYAYFSAAFVPVLMGTFMKKPSAIPALAGALTAIVVHFSVYYGQLTPYTTGAVRNPGVAAAIAILSASAVALILSRFFRSQPSTSEVF
jgi:sodium/pantothenate symporter